MLDLDLCVKISRHLKSELTETEKFHSSVCFAKKRSKVPKGVHVTTVSMTRLEATYLAS